MSNPKSAALIACYQHALGVIREMQHDIERGCSPLLACGMAMVSMQCFKLGRVPKAKFYGSVDLLLTIEQALKIAINCYEEPKVVAALGEDKSREYREAALAVLEKLTRGTEPPLFVQSSN